jgi:hypothetical protein
VVKTGSLEGHELALRSPAGRLRVYAYTFG